MGVRLERLPKATILIVVLATSVTIAEAGLGSGGRGPDRLTGILGLWPAHLPGQWWRILTGVLVNPAFRTATTSLSIFDHWAINMALVVAAGRRVERRLGPWATGVACLGGALASGLWEWARFPSGGPGGGTSGASFGILGAAIVLGVLAGGGYRRYALGVLAVTVFVLTWMYDHEGVYFHLAAMAGGASVAWGLAVGWPKVRPTRPGPLPA
jgi:membrane associated rhomboid family serine protease